MTTAATIRRALPADAAELTRLRGLMFAEYGTDIGGDWTVACTASLARRIVSEPDHFVAVVAADPDRPAHLLACGIGWIERHLPSPRDPSGLRGHIANISTEPPARRRGLANAVVAGLMDFFTEHGILRVDLVATGMGEGAYRAAGFVEPNGKAMSWYAPNLSPTRWR